MWRSASRKDLCRWPGPRTCNPRESGANTPTARLPLSRTDPTQEPNRSNTEPAQQRGRGLPKDEPSQHNPHTSGHKQHRFPHPGRVPEEYGLSEDLAEIVASWDSLAGRPQSGYPGKGPGGHRGLDARRTRLDRKPKVNPTRGFPPEVGVAFRPVPSSLGPSAPTPARTPGSHRRSLS